MAQVLSDSLAVTASLFETLSQGHTAPYPLKGAVDGCQYCAFANACGYLSGVTPHRTVRKVSLSKEEDSHDPNALTLRKKERWIYKRPAILSCPPPLALGKPP